jgi:hypothetical protein
MIFKINDDKFVLDSFHLYWLYKSIGFYLKSPKDEIDPWKLMQFVYERPMEIENSPGAIHIFNFYNMLFEDIRYKKYDIYDIILAMMFYQLPFRKKDQKKGHSFSFSSYIIDKTKRLLSDEQEIIDQKELEAISVKTKKPISEFSNIRNSGTNIFYELIKNNYLNEGLYIKNYLGSEEQNSGIELSKDFILFKKSMLKIKSIYQKQKESKWLEN